MGVAEFELLKNNLIEAMKIETGKIPATIDKKQPALRKIENVKSNLKMEENSLRLMKNSIAILETRTPMTEIQIKQLKQQLNEKNDRDLKQVGELPPIKRIHHIIAGVIGSVIFFVTLLANGSYIEPGLISWMFWICSALAVGYPVLFVSWYSVGFPLEMLAAGILGTPDKNKGIDETDIVFAWPPYHITRRTRGAYQRVYDDEKKLIKLEKFYQQEMSEIDNLTEDALRKSIAKEKNALTGKKRRVSNLQKKLEEANEEMKDLETYLNRLEMKKKELLDSVAYLIPFSSELS